MNLSCVNFSQIVAEEVSFPDLCSKEVLEVSHPVFKRPSPTYNLPIIHHKDFGNLKISPADKNELWDIQHILRQCALEGDGFGLDEFNLCYDITRWRLQAEKATGVHRQQQLWRNC